MKAIILAGGQGSRLHSVTGGQIPKPMVSVGGKPVMEYLLVTLRRNGITDICVTLRTLPEVITAYFGTGDDIGVHLSYRIEDKALGTAGAVAACADLVGEEDFLVCCGDALLDCELSPLQELHKKSGAVAALGLYETAAPLSFGLCVTDREHRVRAFVEKPRWGQVVTNRINTGIYVFSPEIFRYIPPREPYDIGSQLLPRLLAEGKRICALPLEGYWRDVGEEESYYRANVDVLSGKLPHFRPARAEMSGSSPRRYPCRMLLRTADAARLMASLSTVMMEAGADFTDGISLRGVHIAPQNAREVLVEAEDEEKVSRYASLCGSHEAEISNNHRA